MFKKVLYLLVVLNLVSCSYFKKKTIDTRKVIAKVDTTFLYKEDLLALLPQNYSEKDSVILANSIVNSWAKKQLLLKNAKLNLRKEIKEINELVKKYKEDLLINKYREAVVMQNLDTDISQNEIDSFYVKNNEILKLNEDLLMLKFIHADKNIMDRSKIEKLFKSDKKEDIETLIEKEMEFKSYYFNDSIWIKYTDVLQKIPLLEKKDLKNKKPIIKEDSLDFYIIKINKVLRRNSISPKSYVLPMVKQMILHTRKLELLKEIERTLLNDANKNGEYEIYK